MAVNYPTYNFNQSPVQTQSMFPQPQGSSYLINNSLEVSTIPMGMGISIALCLSEGLMYLKTIQNGNPILMAYKIAPYTQESPATSISDPNLKTNSQTSLDSLIQKMESLEKEIVDLKKMTKQGGGKLNEQL